MHVWRQLRRLSALYLHKSVWLLPNRPDVQVALRPILLRVQAQGGTVRSMTIRLAGRDHDALVAEQRRRSGRAQQWPPATPGSAAARAAVQECRDALAAFEAAALAAELGEGETDSRPEESVGSTIVEPVP